LIFSRKPTRLALLAPGPPCEQSEAGVVAGVGRQDAKKIKKIRILCGLAGVFQAQSQLVIDETLNVSSLVAKTKTNLKKPLHLCGFA
jgi:hypothetical protein